MKVELTEEQLNELIDDEWIRMKFGAYEFYMELNQDKVPEYFEIYNKDDRKAYSYVWDRDWLEKVQCQKPDKPTHYEYDPTCPRCGRSMIYKFEYCPKCGQNLDWSESGALK